MANMSSFLECLILNKVLRGTDFTIAERWASLHSDDPGDAGANELPAYDRKEIASFAPAEADPDGSSSESSADVIFTDVPSSTITHVGIWDAETGGNFLWGGPVTDEGGVDVGAAATVRLPGGSLLLTLN